VKPIQIGSDDEAIAIDGDHSVERFNKIEAVAVAL